MYSVENAVIFAAWYRHSQGLPVGGGGGGGGPLMNSRKGNLDRCYHFSFVFRQLYEKFDTVDHNICQLVFSLFVADAEPKFLFRL